MKFIANIIIKISAGIPYLWDALLTYCVKKQMVSCGKNVYIRPSLSNIKGYHNITMGNNARINRGATIYCTDAPLHVGNNLALGPNITIMTGDHRYNVIGTFIRDIHEKTPENDQAVTIEDEIWAGANVTILKGVTVGRGSVIASGAILTKSCPSYSIVGGIPAKVLKFRFSIEEVLEHEKVLYPESERLTREQLEQQREKYPLHKK
ncbi:MAG: acyltransferase [Rikenellaceae bacterium]